MPFNVTQTPKKKKCLFFPCTRRRSVTGTFFEASRNASSSNNIQGRTTAWTLPRGVAQALLVLGHLCPRSPAPRGQATMHEEENTGLEDVEDDDSGRERRHLTHGAECAGRAGRGCGERFSST
uniref:Uncharacterized protein n=1 Tax=Rhipicephalus zambeziensis TaxID=60191 RepID=A0A224YLB8_9ACAR